MIGRTRLSNCAPVVLLSLPRTDAHAMVTQLIGRPSVFAERPKAGCFYAAVPDIATTLCGQLPLEGELFPDEPKATWINDEGEPA